MKPIWKIISGLGVVLALIASFFVIETRWNQADKVLAADTKIGQIQKETIKTFKSIRCEIKDGNEKLDKKFTYQINAMQFDTLTERYYMLKRKLKTNPNDAELIEEFEDIKKRRSQAEENMRNIIK